MKREDAVSISGASPVYTQLMMHEELASFPPPPGLFECWEESGVAWQKTRASSGLRGLLSIPMMCDVALREAQAPRETPEAFSPTSAGLLLPANAHRFLQVMLFILGSAGAQLPTFCISQRLRGRNLAHTETCTRTHFTHPHPPVTAAIHQFHLIQHLALSYFCRRKAAADCGWGLPEKRKKWGLSCCPVPVGDN